MSQVPFENYLSSVGEALEKSPIIQVVAPTGSGKSSILPPWLASGNVKVFVSQPTRVAARNLYNRVRQTHPHLTVGYAAEGEVIYNKDTQLVYCTSGHLRRKMIASFEKGAVVQSKMSFCGILIVDEIHSGSVDNSIILSLWMKTRVQIPDFPMWLILMTATPVPISVDPNPYNVFIGDDVTTPYPITVEYTEDYKDEELLPAIVRKAVELHIRHPIQQGHMLVFLAGSSDVETVANGIQLLLDSEKRNDAVVIGVYGQSSKEEIDMIYKDVGNKRKIIISTNMAESSITISGLGFVLDSMQEKQPGTSSTGGMKLTLSHISKKSANQRRGRTGRTMPGLCVRFMSEAKYESLPENRPLDIAVVPLHNEIIELLKHGINPLHIFHKDNLPKIVFETGALISMGMVEIINEILVVTDIGEFSANIPLSVNQTSFLWRWIRSGINPFVGIVIACIVDTDAQRLFWWPKKGKQSDSEYKQVLWDHLYTKFARFVAPYDMEEKNNHLVTCLKVWCSMVNDLGDIVLGHGSRQVHKWCYNNSIKGKIMLEIIHSIKNVIRSIRDVSVSPTNFDPVQATMKATPILVTLNKDLLVKKSKGNRFAYSKGPGTLTYILSRRGIPGPIDSYKELVIISSIEQQNAKNARTGLIGLAIPPIFVEHSIIEGEIPEPVVSTVGSTVERMNDRPKIIPFNQISPQTPRKALSRKEPVERKPIVLKSEESEVREQISTLNISDLGKVDRIPPHLLPSGYLPLQVVTNVKI